MTSSDGPWLGRGDAPVDRDTWCYVPAGQSLLTRRATACDGRDLLVSVGYGRRRRTTRLGRYVRHHEYAAALGTAEHGEITHLARTLVNDVGATTDDVLALAICAPAHLAAALAARLPRLGQVVWQDGAARAVATGSDPGEVAVRVRLLAALDPTAPHTAAVCEQWLTLPDPDRAAIYAEAGLTWQEALAWERDRRWVYDLDGLATLAALRGAAA